MVNAQRELLAERELVDAGGGRKQYGGSVLKHQKMTGLSTDLKASMGVRAFPRPSSF